MSLFGKRRDVNLFKSVSRELLHNIIEQQIGYYKPKIDEISTNLYGEALNKTYVGPVLLKCFIERGDQDWKVEEVPDVNRIFRFRFLKDDLIEANVFPEVGDVILNSEDYYEIDAIIQNQLVLGKDPDYAYSNSVQDYGSSLSIIVQGHYSRPERFNIKQDRL